MLNGMSDGLLDAPVGDGVEALWVAPLPDSYDLKRRNAASKANKPFPDKAPVPVWDFIIRRGDGVAQRFHVNQNDKKVTYQLWSSKTNPVMPEKGPHSFQRRLKAAYP